MRSGKNRPHRRLAGSRWRKIVGLTGSFGSGKSTVLDIFKRRGFKTLDSDAIAHRLMREKAVQRKILKAFGTLDKKELAALIFTSDVQRKRLEEILHPLIEEAMRHELAKSHGSVAVCDVPLLFEAGWQDRFDRVVFVDAPLQKRIARLRSRGFSPVQVRARLRAQWAVAKKKKMADFVIDNAGSIKDLEEKIKTLIL